MEPKPGTNQQGSASSQQRSGSDTASAANISSGKVGESSAPPRAQSATLASHTSHPMGGSRTGSGQSSQGPEHLRHQDKDAGKGLGGDARSQQGGTSIQSGSSVGEVTRQAADMARQAGDTVRETAGQARERAGEMYEQAAETASEWARGAYEQGSRQFEQMRRSMPDVRRYGGAVQRFVNENPVLVGVAGLAAGLLIGALLPRTRQEDRTFGRWADDLRDQGMRYARDMTQRGREYVEEAFGEGEEGFGAQDDWRPEEQRSGPSGRFQNH